ncbi:hypothetical protein M5K25_009062 [Dendrobium thyrsiflorum]|uniref:Retrotransposon gag domain-containing protein n=1 Tax=Dendrobium thyrsiflorum TaxID=117978 RepID=A0ABD0V4U6_DENTH
MAIRLGTGSQYCSVPEVGTARYRNSVPLGTGTRYQYSVPLGINTRYRSLTVLAAFAFSGEAERWWRSQLQETFGGRLSNQVTWAEFVKVFRGWYVPMAARKQMQDKFMRLVQGDKTVGQYEAEFTMLSRYASHLIPNAEEKCHRFLGGLRDAIRQPLIPFRIEDYSDLVDRARRIESDMQATQKRRDQHKRKSIEEGIQSNQSEGSNGKRPKSGHDGVSSSVASRPMEACTKCGRLHKGQRTSGEMKSGEAPSQRSFGRQNMIEPSVAVPTQNQARQNIRPRVIFWFLMNRREGNVYRRRGTLDERAEEPETDATDGNVGEGRRELPAVADPASSSLNATLETFTQMMATMTQMLRNIQAPASGSGGGPVGGSGGGPVGGSSGGSGQAGGSGNTPMDKYLKLFQDMKPPLFASGGAIEAEDWLERVEKILEGMACPEDRRVTLAAFAFSGEAERWWRSQLQETFGGRLSNQVTWAEFVKVFRGWYVPMAARKQMQDKFMRLVQGDKTVGQYEAEFTMLSRYASHLIPNAEEKCHRFLGGLRDAIRQPLIPFRIEDYSDLVDRARRIESDMQATQKRRDQHKRKSIEEGIQSNQSEGSNGKRPKSGHDGVSSSVASRPMEACTKCGRLHKGQRTSGEMKSGEAPSQRSFGRQNMIEPSVAVPTQNQARQNIRPRVIFWFLMNRREGNVYRRRGTLDERAEEPETDATDGNVGEGRRELPAVADPASSSLNATLETFTQMMATMTQMLRNIQAPASGSGGGPVGGSGGGPVGGSSGGSGQAGGSGNTPMDKYLKLFQDMKPPLFASGGAIEAEDWLERVEKILEGMACPEDRRVTLAAFAFSGEAERWWRSQLQETFGGRLSNQVTWAEFVKVFRGWYVPMAARKQMQDKFMRLVQGDKTVGQYEAEFTMLSRYASHLIPNAEEKCHRFLGGLRDAIRQPLIPFRIEDYSDLVDRARRIESDMQATQKRRDQHKRKSIEEGIQSNQSEGSNGKRPKSGHDGVSSSVASRPMEACTKCGRLHKGQRTSGEMKSGEAPSQRSFGRQNMIEPSVAVPTQNQARQNIRPRVIFWFLMNRREGNVYRRRGTLDERAEEPETDATDGNVGEGRRELPAVADPASSSLNATLETFTQMMATMTQMLRNIQAPASGSGGGPVGGSGGGPVGGSSGGSGQAGGSGNTPMDKYLKLFQDMKPPLFASGGAIEAEDWLERVEKILEGMACPEDRRVTLAAFAFSGEAERWWRSQLQETFGGRLSNQVTWAEFVKVFRGWYVPMAARKQMQDKFMRLVQGDKTVGQYEAEFTMLSRYASHLIPNAEEKCHRFLGGLRDAIRQPLIPFRIEDYSDLVDRARRIESDMQATQKRRDQHKRKSIEEGIQSNQSEGSNGKRPKSGHDGVSSSVASRPMEACTKCGRLHKGQRTSGEMKSGEAPSQRSFGRQNMIEPSVAVPTQNQARQNIRPRVIFWFLMNRREGNVYRRRGTLDESVSGSFLIKGKRKITEIEEGVDWETLDSIEEEGERAVQHNNDSNEDPLSDDSADDL